MLQERLDHALELYEAGLAPLIVLTGGKQEGDTFTEATTGYNYLREHGRARRGAPQGGRRHQHLGLAARRPGGSSTTADADEVVLVTDDYHAYRVEAIAEEVGFDATRVAHRLAPHRAPSSSASSLRETAAVSVGRIIGYDRLFRIDHDLND